MIEFKLHFRKLTLIISLLLVMLLIIVVLAYVKLRTVELAHYRNGAEFMPVGIAVNFQLIGNSGFNPQLILERGYSNTLFTWWDQAHSEESMLKIKRRSGFMFSDDIDYSENSIIISYGRKILDMSYDYSGGRHNRRPFLIVTFSEHDGNIVYFYKTERRGYVPCSIISHCYMMQGDERVLMGKSIHGVIFDTE